VLNTAAVELHRLDKLWSRGKNTRTDGVGAFDMLDVQADMEAIDRGMHYNKNHVKNHVKN